MLRAVHIKIKTEDSHSIVTAQVEGYIHSINVVSDDDGRTDQTFSICCAINTHHSQAVPPHCNHGGNNSSTAAISAAE